MTYLKTSLTAATILAASVSVANAALFTGTDAFGRAASVDFRVDGTQLVVTLTNTSMADTLVPIDVLTGVYWSMNGVGTLTRDSAVLNAGSIVIYDTQPVGGVVGGEFAYNSGLSVHGASYGISSSGLGLFGPGDRFPGDNLAGPTNPDGLQYGIATAGDNTATGNGGITGSEGLIKNSVIIRLGGIGHHFSLDSITNVGFQYGTNLSEPYVPSIPAPGSLAALSLLSAATLRRRR